MKKILFTVIAAVCMLTSCGGGETASIPSKRPIEQDILTSMTLEEKAGQILFVRCVDEAHEDALMKKNPGGLLMFGCDFEGLTKKQVVNKIKRYQSKSRIPLIIGVDEEGGTVVRVSSNPLLAPEKYASLQEIYKNGGMDALIENAEEKSGLLRELGITINLAPVADVCVNKTDFMYDRSMGCDAEETADCISNIVYAMKENGMDSCLKHFPGYGGTADTHTGSAVDGRGAQSFRQVTENSDGKKSGGDFIPFKAGIDAGADCVLVAHNIVNGLDSENPASLSPAVHDILRGELGFDGVIMTDDIAMGAVAEIEDVYIKAINAGNDLLITTDYETAYEQILSAVRDGRISEKTLDSAVGRILKLKGLL